MGQVNSGNLLGAGKLAEECIDRRHVKRRNERFQLGKEDIHQTGNRLLKLSSLANLVEAVSRCKIKVGKSQRALQSG